jgi:hypothetical protein
MIDNISCKTPVSCGRCISNILYVVSIILRNVQYIGAKCLNRAAKHTRREVNRKIFFIKPVWLEVERERSRHYPDEPEKDWWLIMCKLFLDVLGNGELVDGYQIEDSIIQKYDLKPGTTCPFTHLRVEMISPEKVREAEEAGRLKKIKQQKKALGTEIQKREFTQKKETLSAVDRKISKYVADTKATTKSTNHPSESRDFARRRVRSGRNPVMRNRIFKKEEVRMAKAAKVPAKPAKAPAKAKTPVKAPAIAAAKPAKAKAKAVAKAPVKPAKAAAKTPVKAPVKAAAKPAKAKAKAVAKAPAKAKAIVKKPVAKKPAKAKK